MKMILILSLMVPAFSFADPVPVFQVFPKTPPVKDMKNPAREWTRRTRNSYSPPMTLKACLSDSFVACVNLYTGEEYWTGGRKYD